jgi:hypothetical protein
MPDNLFKKLPNFCKIDSGIAKVHNCSKQNLDLHVLFAERVDDVRGGEDVVVLVHVESDGEAVFVGTGGLFHIFVKVSRRYAIIHSKYTNKLVRFTFTKNTMLQGGQLFSSAGHVAPLLVSRGPDFN